MRRYVLSGLVAAGVAAASVPARADDGTDQSSWWDGLYSWFVGDDGSGGGVDDPSRHSGMGTGT